MNYYTVYDIRTDEVLAQGTSRECARALGFSSMKCFRTMVSRAKAGRSARYAVVTDRCGGIGRGDAPAWEEEIRRRWEKLQVRFGKGVEMKAGRPEN